MEAWTKLVAWVTVEHILACSSTHRSPGAVSMMEDRYQLVFPFLEKSRIFSESSRIEKFLEKWVFSTILQNKNVNVSFFLLTKNFLRYFEHFIMRVIAKLSTNQRFKMLGTLTFLAWVDIWYDIFFNLQYFAT